MRAGMRHSLTPCVFGILILLCAQSVLARNVTVRIYKGNKWDPKHYPRCMSGLGITHSIAADRKVMWSIDPNSKPQKAYEIERGERAAGYDPDDLVDVLDTGLFMYLQTNRPTGIAYCSGHVLLMAQKYLKKNSAGEEPYVPPMSAGGNLLYPMALRWSGGVQNTYPKAGDIVFYIKAGSKMTDPFDPLTPKRAIYSPPHVAIFADGINVITKDQKGRVYKMKYTAVESCLPHIDHTEIYSVPWDELTIDVVAEKCEVSNIRSGPPNIWAGGMSKVEFDFKVKNLPAKPEHMKVETKCTLFDSCGIPVFRSHFEKVNVRVQGSGAGAYLEGSNLATCLVPAPGEYAWQVEVRAEQTSKVDEGIAIYEPAIGTTKFTALGKPSVAIERLAFKEDQVYVGGKNRVEFNYKISGVPRVLRTGLEAIYTFELYRGTGEPATMNPVVVKTVTRTVTTPQSKTKPFGLTFDTPGPRSLVVKIELKDPVSGQAVDTSETIYFTAVKRRQ